MQKTCAVIKVVDGKANIFIETTGNEYLNINFIKYLEVHKTTRGRYKVRAWLDTSLPNYLYVLAIFDSEVDAENYIKALISIPDLEIEENPADYLAFEVWRKNIWRELHKEKFGSLSLFKGEPHIFIELEEFQ